MAFRKLSKIEAPKIILGVFCIALFYILLYELVLTTVPGSEISYKLGLLFSKLCYSVAAASIFYLVSQYIPVYLPKQDKKIKIISVIHMNLTSIDYVLTTFKNNIGLHGDDFEDKAVLVEKLRKVKTTDPIGAHPEWYSYLYEFKGKLLDLIRTTLIHSEYLNSKMLHELLIIESKLLAPITFEGRQELMIENLTYAEITIQEILVHHKLFSRSLKAEVAKYKKKLDRLHKEYRAENFNDTPNN